MSSQHYQIYVTSQTIRNFHGIILRNVFTVDLTNFRLLIYIYIYVEPSENVLKRIFLVHTSVF